MGGLDPGGGRAGSAILAVFGPPGAGTRAAEGETEPLRTRRRRAPDLDDPAASAARAGRVHLTMHIAPHIATLATESAFEVLARAQAIAARGRSVINLGIGQPDFPTPPHIVEAACRALTDGHHGYTPANGIPQLREAIAADAARRLGVEVNPGQVVVVPGGKVTMSFAMLMFGRRGAEILYPDPGFPIYRSMIDFSGAMPVGYPLHERDGYSFSADEVLARITPRT